MEKMKHTPLYDVHVKLGGDMAPFAGYMLPIQYPSGIAKEHNAVRNGAGIFDASHMGEFIIEGSGAAGFVGCLVTNDTAHMNPGSVRYSPMCDESGGVIDDLLIYKLAGDKFMLVVNASNKEKDYKWIASRPSKDVHIRDISDNAGLVALQGRQAFDIIKKLVPETAIPAKPYTFADNIKIAGKNVLVSRTGYTGEDGFEIYTKWDDTAAVFEAITGAGSGYGLTPCGLGARDTLRIEAGMPLYGHEISDLTTPLESGLEMFVKLDKPDFIGKQAIINRGAHVMRVGLELIDKGIAREGYPVFSDGAQIGRVTSSTLSPYTGKAIAMAIIDADYITAENIVVDVRGRKLSAKIVPLPFYKRNY